VVGFHLILAECECVNLGGKGGGVLAGRDSECVCVWHWTAEEGADLCCPRPSPPPFLALLAAVKLIWG